MQCANPKVFRLTSKDSDKRFTLFIPCGKCYACQCASRAEWALRFKAEFSDKRNTSAFFLTLTYDDNNLPVCGFNTKPLLDYLKTRPQGERNYWFSVLDKSHASCFLESLKWWYRYNYDAPLYYVNHRTGEFSDVKKPQFLPVWSDNSLPRYYLTGEYGDLSNRSHYHAIVLFPKEIHKLDLVNSAHHLWPYGNFNVQSHISAAAQNYIAKHQVKDCSGTSFQQIASPIFAFSSRYNGGIGRALKSDIVMKRRYYRKLKTGDSSECYYNNPQGSVVYKIPIPRFLKKTWLTELHQSGCLTDEELAILEVESLKNAKKYVETCMLDQNDFTLYSSWIEFVKDINESNNDSHAGRIVYKLSRKYVQLDKERKELYKRRKINRKLQLLTSDNCYTHI